MFSFVLKRSPLMEVTDVCSIATEFALFVILTLAAVTVWAQARRGTPANPDDITTWKGKTIMMFAPHEDDDLASAGTMAILQKERQHGLHRSLYQRQQRLSRPRHDGRTARADPQAGRPGGQRGRRNSARRTSSSWATTTACSNTCRRRRSWKRCAGSSASTGPTHCSAWIRATSG